MDRVDATSRIEDAVIAARSESRGGVILLSGDAGVGKTRVTAEVATRARSIGMNVLRGGCSESFLGVPYLPFVEALGPHVSSAEPDRLLTELGPASRDLARLFPQLGEPDDRADEEPAHARLRLFESLVHLAVHAARPHGLLLIVEDLHWADDSARALLEYFSRRLQSAPVAMVATYRSDAMHRQHPLLALVKTLVRGGLATSIQLDPMAREHVDEMLDAIFGHEALSRELRTSLFDRCEGNPFVLEEMLKEALDRGDILRRGQGWTDNGLPRLSIPGTVAETIMDRFSDLDPSTREVLTAAAVVGRTFDPSIVAAVASVDLSAVAAALVAGVEGQILDASPDAAGSFRHALTREAIYESVAAPDRQALHSRIADVLGAAAHPAAEIAHHLLEAGRWGDAVPVCLEAARAAALRGGDREAVTLYEKVLPLVADSRERSRVLCELGQACWYAGDVAAAERYLSDGVTLDRSGPGTLLPFRLLLGRVQFERGHRAEAYETYLSALPALEARGPSAAVARAHTWLSSLEIYRLNLEAALLAAQHAVDAAEQAQDKEALTLAILQRGWAISVAGNMEEGSADMDSALAIAEGLHPRILGQALYPAALTREWGGSLEGSGPLIRRLEGLAADPINGVRAALLKGDLAFFNGDLRGARVIFADGIALAESVGLTTFAGWLNWELAVVMADLGDPRDAHGLWQKMGEDTGEWSRWERVASLEYCHLASGESAVETVGRLVNEISAMRLPWRFWRSAVGASEWLAARGRVGEARAALTTLDHHRAWASSPWRTVALARLGGIPADAVSGAAAAIGRGGFLLDHLRALLVEAEVRALAGEGDGASVILARVVSQAESIGAVAISQEAADVAGRHGIHLDGSRAFVEAEPGGIGRTTGGAPTERLVTVMFADVRGYTSMTNALAPAVMAEKMRGFYRWARSAVESRGGILDEFRGDSVMATFNLSGARLDHCGDAVRAALALREKAALTGLDIGVGIAVGAAVVGAMTDDDRVTVIGPVANLAARLQNAAGPGQILLDQAAHARVGAALEVSGHRLARTAHQLKGFGSEVEAWSLEGPNSVQAAAVAVATEEANDE